MRLKYFKNELLILGCKGTLFKLDEAWEQAGDDKIGEIDRARISEQKKSDDKERIIDFSLVDSNQSAILFMTPANPRFATGFAENRYARCFLEDLSINQFNKKIFIAHGNKKYQMVAADYSGRRIISVKYEKGKTINELGFNLYLNNLEISNRKKQEKYKGEVERHGNKSDSVVPIILSQHHDHFKFKAHKMRVGEQNKLNSHITCICFLYKLENLNKKEGVVIAELNGNVHLFELVRKEGKKSVSFSLEWRDTYQALCEKFGDDEEDLILVNDFAVQGLKSLDNRYVILRTKVSKMLILRIEPDSMKLVEKKVFRESFTINDIQLTTDGRYLVTGGEGPASLMKLDLSGIDEHSFGGANIDYLKLLELHSNFVDDLPKDQELEKHLKILYFGSEKEFENILYNNNNKNKQKNEDYDREKFRRRNQEKKRLFESDSYRSSDVD